MAFAFIGAAVLAPREGGLQAQERVWATAYYAGWSQGWTNNGHLRAQDIDYGAVTHIVHFSLVPNSDGTLNADANSMTSVNSAELLSAAHAAGKKVLISVGGWGSDVGFRGATSALNRPIFVANLVTFMRSRGYDGIDIDWETLETSDATQYTAFIAALRAALDALTPKPLLTAATAWQAGVFSGIHQYFDQINIMTYDMSGAWPGWVTWHNAPVYDGGFSFPSTRQPVPSIDGEVNRFIAAGIPASKLGVGIDFYGYVWNGGDGTPTGGATAPRQSWTAAPYVQGNVPYHTIMQSYYQPSRYRWDASARAAYLSIDNAGSVNDKFVTYDDEAAVAGKFEYARTKGIGGLIIWELGGGYRPDQPSGQRDLLLQAVKSQLGGGTASQDTTAPVVSITAPSAGSEVSASVQISATASDGGGIAGVRFAVDGVALGGELTSSPYTVSWNTTGAVNGVHLVSATARDGAGNQATARLSVTVANTDTTSDPPPPQAGSLEVYRDALLSPWIDASWGATVEYSSSGQRYGGTGASIQVTQGAWGGLSLHSGSWGSVVPVDASAFTALEFAVFPASGTIRLGVLFENDRGESFPTVVGGDLPAGTWTLVSIPMSRLNPSGYDIHRLDIMEESGSTRTYYVDEIRFTGGNEPVTLAAPDLISPRDGARNVPTTVPLSWSPVEGAARYRVQASTRSDFATTLCDRSDVTATALTVGPLPGFARISWRVAALAQDGTPGPWSQVRGFRTGSTARYPALTGSVGEEAAGAGKPDSYALFQNYPNPFNPSTTISFSIPEEADVTLKVYTLAGEEISTLVSGTLPPGTHQAVWNAGEVAGGFYLYRITAGAFSETRKMLLVR